jgi:hypothetical protein
MTMNAEGAYVLLVLIFGGIFLLYMGTMALRGHFKGLYLIKGIPLAAPASVIYTFFPGGIGFLMLAIALLVPNDAVMRKMVTYTGVLGMLSALALMLWQPRWLKPQWLRWLEDNYPHLLHTLLEEARQGGKAWEARVKTQEDLERWAAGVAAGYGHRVKQKS